MLLAGEFTVLDGRRTILRVLLLACGAQIPDASAGDTIVHSYDAVTTQQHVTIVLAILCDTGGMDSPQRAEPIQRCYPHQHRPAFSGAA